MPNYTYRAKSGPEDIIEGNLEAASEKEAIEKVNQLGYIPLGIKEAEFKRPEKSKRSMLFSSGIRFHDITLFSRQLASFMRAGIPILRALTIISEQSRNPRLKNIFDAIGTDVKEGKPLSQSLMNYPKLFSTLYISMVRAGEESGTLSDVFLRMADYRQKQEDLTSKVRTALIYPVLMAFVAVGTIAFMFVFVLPRLAQIFSNVGQDLPLATQVLISISQGMQEWWALAVLVIFLLVLILWRQAKTKSGALAMSRLKLKMPIFGPLSLKAELSAFSRTLELLIKNGIPILKAIQTTIPTVSSQVIKAELLRSCKDLEQGASFGKSLQKSKLLPAFMVNLLIIGEESGRLEDSLSEIGQTYEKETEEALTLMTTLIEPAVILVMGLVVGFVVIAMLLPVFQINLMVQ